MSNLSPDFIWKIGKLEIPLYVFWEGTTTPENLKINHHYELERFVKKLFYNHEDEVMELDNSELDKYRTDVLTEMIKKNAESANPKAIFNGFNYGLVSAPTLLSDENEKNPVIRLDTVTRRFFDHIAMGINNGEVLLFDNPLYFDNKTKTLKQKYIKDPLSFYNFLPYTIGVNTSIRTYDGYLILMNRGDKNVQYANSKGTGAAGFGDAKKDVIQQEGQIGDNPKGVPHPALTSIRESSEEAGVPIKLKDLRLKHIAMTADDYHIEVSWKAETEMKANEVLTSRKKSKYEGRHFAVPFDLKEETLKHLVNHNEWGPKAHLVLQWQHLEDEFGEEKLVQKINEYL